MDNFDLRNFLIENKLTTSSKLLSEQVDEKLDIKKGFRNVAAGAAMLAGVTGAQAQMKPEYQKAITQIQQDYPGRENAAIRRTKIDSVANRNRSDIKTKHDKDDQRAINTFLKFKRPDLVNASPEKILKAYTAWSEERSKGDDQPYGDLNTSRDLKRAEKCSTVDGPSFLSKLNPFKDRNGCIYSDEDKSGVKK